MVKEDFEPPAPFNEKAWLWAQILSMEKYSGGVRTIVLIMQDRFGIGVQDNNGNWFFDYAALAQDISKIHLG